MTGALLPAELARPCRIMVAPNGARLTKADHPALPLTPAELADEAEACLAAGASAIHLHARDAGGAHTLDHVLVRPFLDAVTARVGERMHVQLTTESVDLYAPAEQIALARALVPPGVSLALRELLPAGEAALADLLAFCAARAIAVEIILYTPEDAAALRELRAHAVVPAAASALFVLGRYAAPGTPTRPADLLPFLAAHDPACRWAVCAFGRSETAAVALAAALGGDVRVGFENNREHADGSTAATNAERVAAVAALVGALGRPLAEGGCAPPA